MDVFYYDRRKLLGLSAFNALLLILSVAAGEYCSGCLGLISIVAVICLISFSASLYVVLFPQKLAVINAEGIKIDHNALLAWKDIASARKLRTPGILKREIIVLKPNENVDYPLSFMQKISRNSCYGEFSIPLYAMTKNDQKTIETLLEKYVKID